MMSELTDKQIDLLNLLVEDEKLQFYTFNRIEGLKWFDELKERGFLDPDKNPEPIPGDEEGYYSIPTWDILKYLLKTSKQLLKPDNDEYVGKYINFIREVTLKTNEKDLIKKNYRTWWYFSQILSNIPPDQIDKNFIENIITKWFNDTFNTSLIVDELGNNLLLNLINSDRKETALSLLDLIVEIKINEEAKHGSEKFYFRGDDYRVKKILETNLSKIASLGLEATKILEDKLAYIFNNSDKDLYSSIWRPAIEDHEQNQTGFLKAENVLVTSIRDFLTYQLGLGDNNEIINHMKALLDADHVTFRRIVIQGINQNWEKLKDLAKNFLKEDYFNFNYQHELFWFLNKHFSDLDKSSQDNILEIISEIDDYSDEEYKDEQIAYSKLRWLSAIKEEENKEVSQLYEECYQIVDREEPNHPDFSSYMEGGVVADKSPIVAREIITLELSEIIEFLNNFKEDKRNWKGPNARGLANEFFKAIKSNPNKFLEGLDEITKLDDFYLSQLVKAFISLWNEDTSFNHKQSLEACLAVLDKRDDLFKEEYSLTLKAICNYVIKGTKSDEHAFNKDLFSIIDGIVENLLTNLDSADDSNLSTSDEVTRAINNNKGQAIEALINYSLRKCRLEHKNKGNHGEAWRSIEHFYNAELEKREENNFEFHALITRYMPNLLYLSKEWVDDNLDKLFTSENRTNWKAAINGISYSKYLHQIFEYLVEVGHFVKTLEEENIKYESKERLITFAGINYFNSDKSEAVSYLIEKWNDEEIAKIVWFIWTLREKLDVDQQKQILDLWQRLFDKLSDKPLKKTLSNLNHWSVYIDEISKESEQLLLQCAPFACVNYNAPFLVEQLSRLVEENPESVAKVFLEMLKDCTPDYDREHIKHIIEVLNESGYNNELEKINDHYLDKKLDFIAIHLDALK